MLKSLLQHHSSKASILRRSAFFIVQLSHPYTTTGKTTALTRWTFVGKVMSLLFNMMSRFVIACLPRSKHLLISRLQLASAVIENKVYHCFHCFPICLPLKMGPDTIILVFWMLSFKPVFFTLPLSPSSRGSFVPLWFLTLGWCHLHIWGCWYFSWQSWFQLELHSAWHFEWCTLHRS